jgi:membrane protein implicated in regulation of membrane protease activity
VTKEREGWQRSGWLGSVGAVTAVTGQAVTLCGAGVCWQNPRWLAVATWLLLVAGLVAVVGAWRWRRRIKREQERREERRRVDATFQAMVAWEEDRLPTEEDDGSER